MFARLGIRGRFWTNEVNKSRISENGSGSGDAEPNGVYNRDETRLKSVGGGPSLGEASRARRVCGAQLPFSHDGSNARRRRAQRHSRARRADRRGGKESANIWRRGYRRWSNDRLARLDRHTFSLVEYPSTQLDSWKKSHPSERGW